jgi:hypothetical protein
MSLSTEAPITEVFNDFENTTLKTKEEEAEVAADAARRKKKGAL